MAKNTGGMSWRSFFNLLAFISVVCIGLAFVIGKIGGGNLASSLRQVSDILAYTIVGISSFIFAYNRRHWAYFVIWVVCVTLIVVFMII